MLRRSSAPRTLRLISFQDVCECWRDELRSSKPTALLRSTWCSFHPLKPANVQSSRKSPSLATKIPDFRPKWPPRYSVCLIHVRPEACFLPPEYVATAGMLASFSSGGAGTVGNPCDVALSPHCPGTHWSPSILLSSGRHPCSLHLQCQFRSSFHNIPITGLPSWTVPSTSSSTSTHSSHKLCYFAKGKYDHIPPFLSLYWLLINLRDHTCTPSMCLHSIP